MGSVAIQPAEPARLQPDTVLGALSGSNSRYEKALAELAGVYRDERAYATALRADDGSPAYWVESSSVEESDGALTVGVSSVRPGRIGDEFAMTRGHIHARNDCAELYYGLSGSGVILMESLDGETRAIEISSGVAVHVPGHWIHRSVNVGTELLTTLFCYPTTAGQDYDIIGDAGGMRTLIVHDGSGGWTTRENRAHTGYRHEERRGARIH